MLKSLININLDYFLDTKDRLAEIPPPLETENPVAYHLKNLATTNQQLN